MKKKQLFTMVMALVLVGAMGIGATLAFMTAQSKTVTNTFTVGAGLVADDITLDEFPVANFDLGGNVIDPEAARVTENDYTNIQAGEILGKDPQVHIAAGTADCYMFVQISGLDSLTTAGLKVDFADSDEWEPVAVPDGKLDGVYAYRTTKQDPSGQNYVDYVIPTQNTVNDLTKLFTKITVPTDAVLHNTTGDAVELDDVVIKACAVQAKNVSFAEAKELYTFE